MKTFLFWRQLAVAIALGLSIAYASAQEAAPTDKKKDAPQDIGDQFVKILSDMQEDEEEEIDVFFSLSSHSTLFSGIILH